MLKLQSTITIAALLLIGPPLSRASPPTPDSPNYVPPPAFIDVDEDHFEADRQNVLKDVLQGVWETAADEAPLRFEITGQQPDLYQFRLLTHDYCSGLSMGRFAIKLLYEPRQSAEVPPVLEGVEIKFDVPRKKSHCIGIPAWVTFKFPPPPNYNTATVTVWESTVDGPNINDYVMIRHR